MRTPFETPHRFRVALREQPTSSNRAGPLPAPLRTTFGALHALVASTLVPVLDRTARRRPRYLVHGTAAIVGMITIAFVVAQPRPAEPVPAAPAAAPTPLAALSTAPEPAGPVPTLAPAPPPAAAVEEAAAIREHEVEEGENLRMVAAKYGVSPGAIMLANGIQNPDLIVVGAKLQIPPQDGVLYELREGETLRAVAEKFDVETQAIVEANDLGENPDLVMAGIQLVVPGVSQERLAEIAESTAQQAATIGRSIPSTRTYEVQPGDTLVGIAAAFGVDVPTILSSNGIDDPDLIRPGVELRILPVAGVEYEVKSGETLADIAWKFQVDLGLLLDYNDLPNPDVIRVGQALVVPGGRLRPGGEAAARPQAPAASRAPSEAPRPVTGGRGAGVVSNAMKYLGYRYVFGGTSPAGFDCSGFVYYIHNATGYPVGRGMWQQFNGGPRIARDELEPGDTVFFANTYMPGLSHNGIYIGNGQFIHAADESTGVIISSLGSSYWASRYVGAARLY